MTAMLEGPLQTHNMLLVVRIRLFQLVQNLYFLETSLVPEMVRQ